jgi:hypothetical protein
MNQIAREGPGPEDSLMLGDVIDIDVKCGDMLLTMVRIF